MPRFYFDITGGPASRDEIQLELGSPREARAEILRLAGDMLRDAASKTWEDRAWRLQVADERGSLILVLHISAEEFPSIG